MQDDGAEEKNCGSGETERDGMGVDVADEIEEWVPKGGSKKLGVEEPVAVDAGKDGRGLRWE